MPCLWDNCLQNGRNPKIDKKFYSKAYDEIKVFELSHKLRIKDLFDLPREDHISRVRRSIQEHAVKKVLSGYPDFGIYLPTDINVAKQRKMNEINWREYLGLN